MPKILSAIRVRVRARVSGRVTIRVRVRVRLRVRIRVTIRVSIRVRDRDTVLVMVRVTDSLLETIYAQSMCNPNSCGTLPARIPLGGGRSKGPSNPGI